MRYTLVDKKPDRHWWEGKEVGGKGSGRRERDGRNGMGKLRMIGFGKWGTKMRLWREKVPRAAKQRSN